MKFSYAYIPIGMTFDTVRKCSHIICIHKVFLLDKIGVQIIS